MGIFSKIKNVMSMTFEEATALMAGASSTNSGMNVNEDTAMRQSAVYSCVNTLSRSMAMMPLHLMKRVGDDKVKATDHKLFRLIHTSPNKFQTSFDFIMNMMHNLLLRGNFYAHMQWGIFGNLMSLAPIPAERILETRLRGDGTQEYLFVEADGATQTWLDSSEVWHVKGMSRDGLTGMSTICAAAELIGLDLAAESFGAEYFGNGTHPGIIVTHPKKLSPQNRESLQRSLADKHSGLGKRHKLLLLQEDMKFNKITIDPKDAQFIELRKFQKAQIIDMFFGIPLALMNPGDTNPTFASAEQFSIDFVRYALMPWACNIEASINKYLVKEEEQNKYFAKFSARGLLRGSFTEQMNGYKVAIEAGIMSREYVQDLLDINKSENKHSEVKHGQN